MIIYCHQIFTATHPPKINIRKKIAGEKKILIPVGHIFKMYGARCSVCIHYADLQSANKLKDCLKIKQKVKQSPFKVFSRNAATHIDVIFGIFVVCVADIELSIYFLSFLRIFDIVFNSGDISEKQSRFHFEVLHFLYLLCLSLSSTLSYFFDFVHSKSVY